MPSWWRAAATTLKRHHHHHHHHLHHRHYTIQATPREIFGHRISHREREHGRIPAIVFSQTLKQTKPDDPTSISSSGIVSRKMLLTTETRQIKHILKSVKLPFFYSTTFPIQIRAGPGSCTVIHTGQVLPIKVHQEEESGKILNLVFVWAEDGTSLKVDVPIVFKGQDICPGLKNGGFLRTIRPSLKFLCPAESIPPQIEVDLSNLDIGDRVCMHDVTVDSALTLLSKNDNIPICKICSKEVNNDEVAE